MIKHSGIITFFEIVKFTCGSLKKRMHQQLRRTIFTELVSQYFLGVVETVVLENGVFVPYRKQVVLTKIGEYFGVAFYPQNKGFCSSHPGIDENDENGGCHPDKMTVCQKHRFDNPDFRVRDVKCSVAFVLQSDALKEGTSQ